MTETEKTEEVTILLESRHLKPLVSAVWWVGYFHLLLWGLTRTITSGAELITAIKLH